MKAVLALACIVLLLSIGCSAERSSTPSDSRKETKKSHRSTREEARSAPGEDNGEASRPAPKWAAEQSSEKPKPKPVPRSKSQSKPHANPEPKQIPAASEGRGVRGSAVTVSRVVDGDTIEISPAIDGVREVRLIGVDTPETVDPTEGIDPFGSQASVSVMATWQMRRLPHTCYRHRVVAWVREVPIPLLGKKAVREAHTFRVGTSIGHGGNGGVCCYGPSEWLLLSI